MPQADSSRNRPQNVRWTAPEGTWPIDPEAPVRMAQQRDVRQQPRPTDPPEQDGRTPTDPDGNEEQAREEKKKPASSHASGERASVAPLRSPRELETEDTGHWVASQRFTADDELEDTWPNVPARYVE